MKTIWADFNAAADNKHLRLTTIGSRRSIDAVGGVHPGERVLLDDEDSLRCEATIVERYGELQARLDWDTLQHF